MISKLASGLFESCCPTTDFVAITSLKLIIIFFFFQEIMKQRLDKPMESDDKEPFNLDIVDCRDARSAEDFLSEGFEDLFKYSFRCLVFFPLDKVSFWAF
jgi:hypothetical protein